MKITMTIEWNDVNDSLPDPSVYPPYAGFLCMCDDGTVSSEICSFDGEFYFDNFYSDHGDFCDERAVLDNVRYWVCIKDLEKKPISS